VIAPNGDALTHLAGLRPQATKGYSQSMKGASKWGISYRRVAPIGLPSFQGVRLELRGQSTQSSVTSGAGWETRKMSPYFRKVSP
jgi:hypothetical protein